MPSATSPRPRPSRSSGARLGVLALSAAIGLASACRAGAPAPAAGIALTPGDHRLSLQHDGRTRTYVAHLPPQVRAGRALPLVLNFHGGGGRGVGQQTYARMDALADREGFITVYPDGTGVFAHRLLTWNAGRCCGYAADNNVDDVGFVRRLLDELATAAPVDRTRVYATGLSNGAMMAYRLAAEMPERLAAIAPVAAAWLPDAFPSQRPVPIMHIHSVDDPRALYEGGLGPPFPMTNRRVLNQSVEETLAGWLAHDGCPTQAQTAPTLHGRPDTAEATHTATRYVYGPCRAGTEVVHWKLTGAGHVWPGGQPDYLESLLGPSTTIIDANAEMWRFFERFALAPAAIRAVRH